MVTTLATAAQAQTVDVAPASPSALAAEGGTATLDTVNVVSKRQDDSGYVAKDGTTATKTDAPLLETPQSVSVVTREQLDDQGAEGLSSAIRYIAGVAAETQGFQPSRDWSISIRGFDATTYGLYHNGLFWDSYAQTDAYQLDHIEILKGPSSVLYGLNAPGGLINMVTKHPNIEPLHELEADYGSYSRKQLKADLGGPVDGSGHWYYRLTTLYRDSNTQIDHLPDDRILLAPSLLWKPDDRSSLTLLADYQKDNGSWIQFMPASGTLLANPNGRISTSLDEGQPGSDHMHRRQFSLGYELQHSFSEVWTLRQNFRAAHNNTDLRFTYYSDGDQSDAAGFVIGSGEREIQRSLFGYLPRDTSLTLDTQLRGHWNSGWLEQTVLVGVDALRYYTDIYSSCCASSSPLDVFNPVYGADGVPGPFNHNASTQEQVGFYAQDQLKLDRHWIALLGGRQDFVRNVSDSYSGTPEDREYDHKFSGRAGLLYLSDNGLAPYLSYSQSFVPTAGINQFTGERLKPTTGTQYEAGVKYEPVGGRLSATLSAFNITQSNIASSDPNNPLNTLQIGEERSRGVELEVRGRVTNSLQLIGSYSYNPVKITGTTIPGQLGTHPPQVPTRLASLWADYTIHNLGPGDLGAGFGVRRTGGSFGDQLDTPAMAVPGYTLLDGLLHYDIAHWRLALNGSNLTDKTYVAACNGYDNCYYGYRRSIIGSVRYAW